jgi:hypothetical protein
VATSDIISALWKEVALRRVCWCIVVRNGDSSYCYIVSVLRNLVRGSNLYVLKANTPLHYMASR